jgi:hypothetical protein
LGSVGESGSEGNWGQSGIFADPVPLRPTSAKSTLTPISSNFSPISPISFNFLYRALLYFTLLVTQCA